MTFRSRLLLAFAAAALLPLLLLARGVRRQLESRLTTQYSHRVAALAAIVREDVAREGASVAARLATLARRVGDDNRLRLALLHGTPSERAYLLDYGEQAMRLTGLSMLQIQDDAGRIVSSGHFRNEFDRLEPELPRLLSAVTEGATLVPARTPNGPQLVLARVDSVRIGGRRFTLVGGTNVDSAFFQRLARSSELTISLVIPDSGSARDTSERAVSRHAAAELFLPYVMTPAADSARLASAPLLITHSRTELDALRADVDRWFLAALALAVAGALALGIWLSSRLSRPLAELAHATGSINLDGPDVKIAVARDDEIGTVARGLVATARRLRANAAKLRDAERLATVGEMARQVNHDIKNGLIPIRNVVRHLAQVQEQEPHELPAIFAERRSTLESSLGYLDTLARNYARLSPQIDKRVFDANAVILDVARAAAGGSAPVRTRLQPDLPPIFGDPVILRRILDNLARNAVESLTRGDGSVTLISARTGDDNIRVTVADTGCGMTAEALSRAFDDFYTTKDGGIGLGLTLVRRLTGDMHGTLRVASEPGRGTTVTIELPAAIPQPAEMK
jgi:two-component system nitrogen regulation sensor histidine kinase NtrY